MTQPISKPSAPTVIVSRHSGQKNTALEKTGGIADRLLHATCRMFGVTEAELRSSRRAGLSEPRWAISYVLLQDAGWTLQRVGNLLNKDHTAILYGYHRACEMRENDEPFFDAVEYIRDAL